jgi:hypothetical protein
MMQWYSQVSVDASSWSSYQSGIFDGCKTNPDLNHAVQLVGYGVDQGTEYWLMSNSWVLFWVRMDVSDY